MSTKGSITTSDYLPYSEYERLIECLENDGEYKWAAYCVCSFAFALRISDVIKIKWNQVIGPRNIVVTEKKTKKTKSIVIGEKTSEKLYKYYNFLDHPDLDTPIVCNKIGEMVSKQYVNRQLKTWKEKYNLEVGNFSSHSFRKTFGRYVYNKMDKSEEALLLLNRIFRHANIATTMIYLGLRDDEISNIFMSL